jgi:N-acyl amino acid synthase of PEP-CTERM/exosortase system
MPRSEKDNLSSSFKQYFEIVPAFSEVLKDEAFRIRHQVYCEDLKFEEIRLDGREFDEYDRYSIQLLVRSIQTNEFVGCTRLIYPKLEDSSLPLPIEKSCIDKLDKSIIDITKLPRDKIAEVSRLAVLNKYRRRKSDTHSDVSVSNEDFGTEKQPRFPYIPVSLYLGATKLSHLHGIKYVLVLTEERLAKHFCKLGFDLQFIGNPIEHHGKRIPSMMSVDGTINKMCSLLRPLYQIISADIEADIPIDYKSQIPPAKTEA